MKRVAVTNLQLVIEESEVLALKAHGEESGIFILKILPLTIRSVINDNHHILILFFLPIGLLQIHARELHSVQRAVPIQPQKKKLMKGRAPPPLVVIELGLHP